MAQLSGLNSRCPKGSKMWLLSCGVIEADSAFVKLGCGCATATHNPPTSKEMSRLVMISVLIEHPGFGLILYDTAAGKNYPEVWGSPFNQVFTQVDYKPEQELTARIASTGHDVKDVKAVIISHLHIDHSGGLENFLGTDVPIYVHERELAHAFCSVATKSDWGVYLPHYLKLDGQLNWKTLAFEDTFDFLDGVRLRLAAGHTPGLLMLELNLEESGIWLFTSDLYHIKANWEGTPQGFLMRFHQDWYRNDSLVKVLAKRTNAKVILGHCEETLNQYKLAPFAYT